MEQALGKHEQKTKPALDMKIWDFTLEFNHGDIQEVTYDISLKQGYIGRNARVRFSATEELCFPEEKEIHIYGFDEYIGMKNPKYFWHKVGDMNPSEYKVNNFKVKAPDIPGEYTMSYWLQCDEFTAEDKTFVISVI